MKINVWIAILVVALVCPGAAGSPVHTVTAGEDGNSLESYIRRVHSPGTHQRENNSTLVFFLKFIDFGCSPCLTNFLDFCDTLRSRIVRYGQRDIVLVFERDQNKESTQARIMKSWARANNLNYPLYLAPSELYDENGIGHSTAIVLNRHGTMELFENIPIPAETQRSIIRRLFGSVN